MRQLAVLAGGPSSEHEVSLDSSREILRLLRKAGHAVRPVLITREGGWLAGGTSDDLEALLAAGPGDPDPATTLAGLRRRGEVAYLGLHGPFGEDGTVQRLLEQAGVPYTGSGPVASSIGMDKELSKLAATKVGARCAAHELVTGDRIPTWNVARSIGYPCFVKPVCAGSSVGVTRVADPAGLEAAVLLARSHDGGGRCLVEELVEGREVTCAVLRRAGEVVTLPLVAIESAGRFYDYEAKYHSAQTRYRCPAPVGPAAGEQIAAVAQRLHARLELRGVVRLDFIVRSADEVPVFLELNTLPGFTSHSLVPMAARAAGWEPVDVLEAVLDDVGGTP